MALPRLRVAIGPNFVGGIGSMAAFGRTNFSAPPASAIGHESDACPPRVCTGYSGSQAAFDLDLIESETSRGRNGKGLAPRGRQTFPGTTVEKRRRAFAANPRLLILDEASEGSVPRLREKNSHRLTILRQGRLTMLGIDIHIEILGSLADHHSLLEKWRIVRYRDAAVSHRQRTLPEHHPRT